MEFQQRSPDHCAIKSIAGCEVVPFVHQTAKCGKGIVPVRIHIPQWIVVAIGVAVEAVQVAVLKADYGVLPSNMDQLQCK